MSDPKQPETRDFLRRVVESADCKPSGGPGALASCEKAAIEVRQYLDWIEIHAEVTSLNHLGDDWQSPHLSATATAG